MTDAALRVIVADDEPDVRLLLRLQLQGVAGVEVVGEAGDGTQAVELCRTLQPDAIVMDLLMPRMMGIEAIEKLRSEFPDLGVVAYTATAGDFVRHEMDRLGVPLLLKSGEIGQLVDALRASAGRRRV
ncbi:MAG: two-component system, NarL family, nitrate/nitrite response regulator NarL [Actinomycetota bacterium]|nr:two-component system, NarL family, nitrate/nitrite response regulator NarL [Actinomycetota bacterium]